MNNNLLEGLKKIALRFHIDPKNTIGHAARVETVIKVLSDINKSYKNFLEIEFKKIQTSSKHMSRTINFSKLLLRN